jgi:signal transduction histidine kinase
MKRYAVIGSILSICLIGMAWFLLRFKPATLPYTDRFAKHKATEWTTMGGNWEIDGNAVVNRSDEHGAKLITGSSEWGDITLDADLKLIGHSGDVGLLIRVKQAEPGVDAYSGYYVGLRSDDQALVMGRADHGWMEGRPTVMVDGVDAGVWYHLHLVALGCTIGTRATNTVTGTTTFGVMQEQNCVSTGRIGLRSMTTGGAWKNVIVKKATIYDLAAIRSHVSFVQTPKFSYHEADYDQTGSHTQPPELSPGDIDTPDILIPSTIEAVKMQRTGAHNSVVLRGVVTLLSPLYVQDSTGGIAVESSATAALNLGDEVKLTGHTKSQGYGINFLAQAINLTGDRNLLPPSSVTSTQAAGVLFDGKLAELRARLLSKSMDSAGRVTLFLEDSAQTFRAIGPRGLSDEQFEALLPGSELRIRGVCRVGPWDGKDGGAFTILMRSMDDAEVFAGPPWWSPRYLILDLIAISALIALTVYIYLRIERWQMRAILHERERLAHEMHDTLAQSFAGVGFHLQGVRNSARSGTMTMSAVVDKLTIACDLVTRTHREASSEIAALHPGTDDDDADVLTLLERCAYTMLEGNEMQIRLIREGTAQPLSLAVRDALYHIGRESIANVLRHARASVITLRLKYEFRSLELDICDDGCGFNYGEHSGDFGFRGMRRRSADINAELNIISGVNQGTCVHIKAPYTGRALGRWMQFARSSANIKATQN